MPGSPCPDEDKSRFVGWLDPCRQIAPAREASFYKCCPEKSRSARGHCVVPQRRTRAGCSLEPPAFILRRATQKLSCPGVSGASVAWTSPPALFLCPLADIQVDAAVGISIDESPPSTARRADHRAVRWISGAR